MTLHELQEQVRRFAQERDWEQFHNPKNLSMALAGEAGELLEIFQWLTPAQSTAIMDDPGARIRHELADVLAYLLRLADVLEVDLAYALRWTSTPGDTPSTRHAVAATSTTHTRTSPVSGSTAP
jgi:NTP pyrophosphatase (non-canonical NTP hydrolase)